MVLAVPHAPSVKLDDKYYKLVDKMEALTEAPPSLKDAKSLTVKGPVLFRKGCVFKGDTLVVNGTLRPGLSGAGFYLVWWLSMDHKSCKHKLEVALLPAVVALQRACTMHHAGPQSRHTQHNCSQACGVRPPLHADSSEPKALEAGTYRDSVSSLAPVKEPVAA